MIIAIFFQLTNEKNCLIEQVNSENLKIEHLMQQQQMYNNQLQAQQKEVEMLTKETISLNEQLHAEKITIVGKCNYVKSTILKF